MLHHKPELKAPLRQAWRAFLLGGPTGLSIFVRSAVVNARLRSATRTIEREQLVHQRELAKLEDRVCRTVEREKAVHRDELAKLRAKVNRLAGQQQCLQVAGAQFRRYCEKKAVSAEVQP